MKFWNRRLRSKSGNISSVAAHVALGGARAITSHARCIYNEKYCRKGHRFPSIIFGFDAILLLIVLSLATLVISLFLFPLKPPKMSLIFRAPEIIAVSELPISADLTALPGGEHEQVRLVWHLPPGMELLRSEPPIQSDGSVYIGSIRPGETKSSHAVVRVFHPVGTESTIGFTVNTVENGTPKQYVASIARSVRGSLLRAEIPEEFYVDAVAPSNVVLPIVITNASTHTLPFVEVRPEAESGIQFDRVVVGDLLPGERRFVMIHLGLLRESPVLRWGVYSASRELDRGVWSARVQAWDYPVITSALVMRPNEAFDVNISRIAHGDRLLVVHPFLDEPVQVFAPDPNDSSIHFPAASSESRTQHEWFIEPLRLLDDGTRLLGPATMGVFVAPLPFTTRVRYRSSSGDQLGVGSHPPIPGEETRYWVFLTLGPVDRELKNIQVEANLPPHVTPTGNVAAPYGGSSRISGGSVRWNLPRMGRESGLVSAQFGFEIAVIPDEAKNGQPIVLVSRSMAQATDIPSGLILKAEESAKTSQMVDEAGEASTP